MMLWSLYDDLMSPHGVHHVEGPLRPSIEITLYPTKRVQIRDDSNQPTRLIPLARRLAKCRNFWRGHQLIAWAERAWFRELWRWLRLYFQGRLSIWPLRVDNYPTIRHGIAPHLTHISPHATVKGRSLHGWWRTAPPAVGCSASLTSTVHSLLRRQRRVVTPLAPGAVVPSNVRIPKEPEREVGDGSAMHGLAVAHDRFILHHPCLAIEGQEFIGRLECLAAGQVSRPLNVHSPWDVASSLSPQILTTKFTGRPGVHQGEIRLSQI